MAMMASGLPKGHRRGGRAYVSGGGNRQGNVPAMAGGARPTTQDPAVSSEEASDEAPAGTDTTTDAASTAAAPEEATGTERRWRWALVAICALALVVRLVYLFGWQAVDEVAGDAYYYHAAANLLADGEGFVHPYAWDEGVRAPGADHPPGYSTVLAVFSFVGFDSIRSHQVVTSLIGTGTVALMGVLGRRLAGRRVGLMAAGFGAVYPNLWLNDPSLMSESLAMTAGVAFSLVAYWAWARPTVRRLAVTGAVLGLATLVRAEAALLLVLVVLPLCVWVPGLTGWRPRMGRLAVAGATAGLVLVPWVVPNLVRFEHPATLSTQLGPTLEVANCDHAYYDVIGSWDFSCASDLREEADGVYRYRDFGTTRLERRPEVVDVHDRSELDLVTREVSFDYMREHRDRLPFVLWARFASTWGLYAPNQQIKVDVFTDSRPYDAARVGLGLYYLTAAAAVVGVVALRRRGVPSFPLTAWVVNVAITVVLFYGTTRFRAPAEPALVLLGAVGVNWLLIRFADRRADGGEDADSRSGEPAAQH